MKEQNNKSTTSNLFRKEAEKILENKSLKKVEQLSEQQVEQLIYELEVHQLELELQNKTLIQSKLKLEIEYGKYTEMYNFAPSGFVTLSSEGIIIELNLLGSKMLGKERSQLIDKNFDTFVSIHSKPIFKFFLDNVFKNKTKESCHLILLTKNNQTLKVQLDGIFNVNSELCLITIIDLSLVSWSFAKNRIGKQVKEDLFLSDLEKKLLQFNTNNMETNHSTFDDKSKLQLVIRDIIMRKRVEEDLMQLNKALHDRVNELTAELLLSNEIVQHTQHNFEAFFKTIDKNLFVLNKKKNLIHTNANVIDLFGYSKEELAGKPFLDLYPVDRRDEADKMMNEMMQGKLISSSVPMITKTGDQIFVDTKVIRGFWGEKPAFFCISEDISQIRITKEQFLKTFHLNPSACSLCNSDDLQYVEVNDAFCNMLGFNKDEILGRKMIDIVTGIKEKEMLQKIAGIGNATNMEMNLKSKNGATKHVLLSSEDILLQGKKYFFMLLNDITAQNKIQNKIIKAVLETEEKERDYYSKEIHDSLGPLLSTIKLYLQWSEMSKSNESQKEAIVKAEEILEEALMAVKEISNKLSPHLLKSFGLISAIQHFADKLEETSDIRISIQSNISRRYTKEIELVIYRVIIESIHNTIKHAKANKITLIMNDTGKKVEIQYMDDGIGMDVDNTFSLHKGLGLFNLQNRIQSIGGKIVMTSSPGHGIEYKIVIALERCNKV